MTRACASLALMVAFQLSPAVYAADRPCEKQTAPLMTTESSWHAIYTAAVDLPSECFSGYFGEGISDTLVRKMDHDWSGFLEVMAHHRENKRFFELVLKSINATLNPDDIVALYKQARSSCPAVLKEKCDAIATRSKVALADYDPPRAIP
jgi:hypothetical protein